MFEKDGKLFVPCRDCGRPVEITDYQEADICDFHDWYGRCVDDPDVWVTETEKGAMK